MPHHQRKRPEPITSVSGVTYKLPLLSRVYVTVEPGRNAYERLRKEAAAFGLRTDRDPVATQPVTVYDVYGREDRVEAFRLTSDYAGVCAFALADVNVLGERSSSIRPKDHGRHNAPKGSRAPTRDEHSGGQHANRRWYVFSLDGEIVMGPYFVPPLVPLGFEVLPTGDDPPVGTAPWSKRSRRKSSSPPGWRGDTIQGGAGPFPEYLTYGGEREGPNPVKA